jgi:hypothetical protein
VPANTFKLTEQRDTLLQTAKTRAVREPAEARFEPVTVQPGYMGDTLVRAHG